jgi:hypothetical protein
MSLSRPVTHIESDSYSPSTTPQGLSSVLMPSEEVKGGDTGEEPYRLFNAEERIIIEEYVSTLMERSKIEIEDYERKIALYSIKLSIIHFIRECIEVISWLQKEEDGYTIFFYAGDQLPKSLLYAVETAKEIDPSHHTERTLNLGINSFTMKKPVRMSFANTPVQHNDIKAHGRNIQVYIPMSYAFNGAKSFKDMVTIINKLSAQNNLAAENINIFLGPTEDASLSISKNKERRKVMINSWIDATRKLFSDDMRIKLLVHENYDIRNDNIELVEAEWYRSNEIKKAKKTFISILNNYPVLGSLLVKDAINHLKSKIPQMGIETQAPLSYVPPEESLITDYKDEDFETFAKILAQSIAIENSLLRKSESEGDIFEIDTDIKDTAEELKEFQPALNNLLSDTSSDDSDGYSPALNFSSEDVGFISADEDEFETKLVRRSRGFFRKDNSDCEDPLPNVESSLDLSLSTEELAKREFISFDKDDYKERYRDDSKIYNLIKELSKLKKLVKKSKSHSKQDVLKYISSKLDVIYNEQVSCPGFFSYTLFALLFDAVSKSSQKSETTFINSFSFFNNESSLKIEILSLIRAMAFKAFKINLKQLQNSDIYIEINIRQKIFRDALAEPLFSKFLRNVPAYLQPQNTNTATKIMQCYKEFNSGLHFTERVPLYCDTNEVKDWKQKRIDSYWEGMRDEWKRMQGNDPSKKVNLWGLSSYNHKRFTM